MERPTPGLGDENDHHGRINHSPLYRDDPPSSDTRMKHPHHSPLGATELLRVCKVEPCADKTGSDRCLFRRIRLVALGVGCGCFASFGAQHVNFGGCRDLNRAATTELRHIPGKMRASFTLLPNDMSLFHPVPKGQWGGRFKSIQLQGELTQPTLSLPSSHPKRW